MACKTFHGKKYFNIGKSWKPILYLDAFKYSQDDSRNSSFFFCCFLPTPSFMTLGKRILEGVSGAHSKIHSSKALL